MLTIKNNFLNTLKLLKSFSNKIQKYKLHPFKVAQLSVWSYKFYFCYLLKKKICKFRLILLIIVIPSLRTNLLMKLRNN